MQLNPRLGLTFVANVGADFAPINAYKNTEICFKLATAVLELALYVTTGVRIRVLNLATLVTRNRKRRLLLPLFSLHGSNKAGRH